MLLDDELAWDNGISAHSLVPRQELEGALPRVIDCVGIDTYILDRQHWDGVYSIPNCPQTFDINTLLLAYKCATTRFGYNPTKVSLTKTLTSRGTSFIDRFQKLGGRSLYHWAFVAVHQCRNFADFRCQASSNTGLFYVFNERNLTPWRLSQMFRHFPSSDILCRRPCDAVVVYHKRQQTELISAAKIVAETNRVEAGINYLRDRFPLDELKQLAETWRRSAKLVEDSLTKRIAAGEDVWLGLLPGLEK